MEGEVKGNTLSSDSMEIGLPRHLLSRIDLTNLPL